MKERDLQTIVYKVVGNISPVGETNVDNERFENLQEFVELVHALVWDLHAVSHCTNNHEYSMKRAGQFAKLALEQLRDVLD